MYGVKLKNTAFLRLVVFLVVWVLKMLELIGMRFTATEVLIVSEGVPEGIEVGVDVEKVTKHEENAISLVFNYYIGYRPDVASVKLRGIAFCQDSPQNIKKIISQWKKKKEITPELGANAINMINANAAVNALLITRPFNLMPHYLPPPVFAGTGQPPPTEKKKKKSKKKKKGKKKR
jgi:hypothetical protein